MPSRFITSVLVIGALIAVLAGAQPAQAGDRDDLKRFIGTAAGLYLLGKAIEQGRIEVHQDRPKAHHDRHDRRHGNRHDRHDRKKHLGKGHHGKKKWHRAPLPRHCIRRVGGRHDRWRALSAYCLNRTYHGALPRACKDRAWYKGKSRPVYRIGCLKHRGYTLARH